MSLLSYLQEQWFGGPLFYMKEVLGKQGRRFTIRKLRTMSLNAEKEFGQVIQNGRDQYGKPNKDHRITRMGKMLRKYWIDEIPQIWSLIKGDLRLIGIRAKGEEEIRTFPEDMQEQILNEKPGLIGIHYSSNGKREYFDVVKEYLEKRKQHPKRTDVEYFFRTTWNILINSIRST
ncbi:MAG: sugar transferase [Nanoarchaeota archaeon]|nr:sugar transferase [Nanoarchaeota archaeon]